MPSHDTSPASYRRAGKYGEDDDGSLGASLPNTSKREGFSNSFSKHYDNALKETAPPLDSKPSAYGYASPCVEKKPSANGHVSPPTESIPSAYGSSPPRESAPGSARYSEVSFTSVYPAFPNLESKPSADGSRKHASSSGSSPSKELAFASSKHPELSSSRIYPDISALEDEISALTSAASIDLDSSYSSDKKKAPPATVAALLTEEDEEVLDSKPPAARGATSSAAAASAASKGSLYPDSAASKDSLYPDVSDLEKESNAPSAKFKDFMQETATSNKKKKAPPPPAAPTDTSSLKQWPPPAPTVARLAGVSEEEQEIKERTAAAGPPPATSPGVTMIPGIRTSEPWVPNNDEEDPEIKSLNPSLNGFKAWSSEEESKEDPEDYSDYDNKESDISDDDGIIKATMVMEDAEVPEAEAVSERALKRRRRILIVITIVCVIGIIVGLAVGLTQDDDSQEVLIVNATSAPTLSPTSSPTVTPRPTIEEVTSAQILTCGVTDKKGFSLENQITNTREGFDIDLCRAVAAAVLGDPDKIETIVLGGSERFLALRDREVDLLARVTTHTMERDVHERDSLVGFSFAAPYLYDGLGFGGVPTYVDCADKLTTFGECISMKVCVLESTTHSQTIGRRLPDESILLVESRATLYQDLNEGICNVIAGEQFDVAESVVRNAGYRDEYKVGETLLSKEPLAMVVRDSDEEWFNLVSWVFQSLLIAEKQGITRATANQFPTTTLFDPQFSNMFRLAIAAVGNYGDIYERHLEDIVPRTGLNTLNTELNTGLIYSLPFGDLSTVGQGPRAEGTIGTILQRGQLRCGIIERPGTGEFIQDATAQWTGIDTDFCRAVAAALFTNYSEASVEFIRVADNSEGLKGLSDGQIDVFAGGAVTFERDVLHSPTSQGYAFTPPYFYYPRNSSISADPIYGETLSLVARQDDSQWLDFLTWIVQATFFAEESGIEQVASLNMPEVLLFGDSFRQMLRDAIQAVGNYGEIYRRTVERTFPRNSTANMVNGIPAGPQQYPLAGLL